MDILDYGSHYALMATKERIRDHLRERSLIKRRRRAREAAPLPEVRRRWSIANLVRLLATSRNPG